MKTKSIRLALAIFAFAGAIAKSDTVPAVFSDPEVLKQVMAGKVVQKVPVDTAMELQLELRLFIKNAKSTVTPRDYIDLVTDHPRYEKVFPDDVKHGETTEKNADKTEFKYVLVVDSMFGEIEIPGKQKVTYAKDATSEAKVVNQILAFENYLSKATETATLYPYNGGILVFDQTHIVLKKAHKLAGTVKKKIKSNVEIYAEKFRKELEK